jgi:hypothetical protein
MTPGGASSPAWSSAAALIITALVIFTLAALVTAIITAHQPGYPGFGPARELPVIHHIPDQRQFGPQAPGM